MLSAFVLPHAGPAAHAPRSQRAGPGFATLRRTCPLFQGGSATRGDGSRAVEVASLSGVCSLLALAAGRRARNQASKRQHRVQLGPFRRDLTLDGYPIHGPGYYWTLSRDTEAILIYMPIADDVNAKDIVFDCRDWRLKFGVVPEKGDLVIDDRPLYKVDVEESYFLIDEGEFGERCAVVWLYKYNKDTDWYAYDRFEPVSERFLLEGEKNKANLAYKITHKCFIDIEVEEEKVGRVVIGLWGELCPKTVENFRCLCTGEKGDSEETGEPLHYKGTCFHRIIPGFCLQGGQTFENEEGSGGESIYGRTFEDENLRVKFKKTGMLAMANGGPNTNGSQFFITSCKADHLSHHCVGFGEVLEGLDVVNSLERLGGEDGEPTKLPIISDCGELELTDQDKKESDMFWDTMPSLREMDGNSKLREDLVTSVCAGAGSGGTST